VPVYDNGVIRLNEREFHAAATRKAILEQAKKEFLSHGFADASLRVIAAGACVTTGALYRHFRDKNALFEALVAPIRDEVIQTLQQQTNKYIQLLDSQGMQPMWERSEWNMQIFIRYIYRHFDVFRLLFLSDQTVYEDFLHTLIRLEVECTLCYLAEAKRLGNPVRILEEQELHMIAGAQFSFLFELVSHQVPKKDALRYAATMELFMLAGWKEVILA